MRLTYSVLLEICILHFLPQLNLRLEAFSQERFELSAPDLTALSLIRLVPNVLRFWC